MPICAKCNRYVYETTAQGICQKCNRENVKSFKREKFARRSRAVGNLLIGGA